MASSFLFKAHPLSMVFGSLWLTRWSGTQGAALLPGADSSGDQPDEMALLGGLVHAPDGSGVKITALVACYTRDPARAESDLRR